VIRIILYFRANGNFLVNKKKKKEKKKTFKKKTVFRQFFQTCLSIGMSNKLGPYLKSIIISDLIK
jgi:hypothetical protein